jgi:putative protease
MEDEEGNALTDPRNPQMVFRMRLPRPVPVWSILRIERDLSAKS